MLSYRAITCIQSLVAAGWVFSPLIPGPVEPADAQPHAQIILVQVNFDVPLIEYIIRINQILYFYEQKLRRFIRLTDADRSI